MTSPIRQVVKSAVARLGGPARGSRTLCLHRVSRESDPAACSLVNIYRFLDEAARRGFTLRPLADVEAQLTAAEPATFLALVFDDACASALPAIADLRANDVAVTVAVPTAVLDPAGRARDLADEPMSPVQLRMLVALGAELLAHGHNHVSFVGLTSTELRAEVRDCLDAVAQFTGIAADRLVLPFGAVDDHVTAVLADEGVRIAHGLGPGSVGPTANPWNLPRLCLSNVTPTADLAFGLSRAYDLLPLTRSTRRHM